MAASQNSTYGPKDYNRKSSLDTTYSTLNHLAGGLEQSIKEAVDNALAVLRTELRLRLKLVEKYSKQIQQIQIQVQKNTDSKLLACIWDINPMHRVINRLDFIVQGFSEGLKDIPCILIKLTSFYAVPMPARNINFTSYSNRNKSILVKCNSIGLRGKIINRYFMV